jgi:WD40 repeat protein/class 3 adenylate cyclase
MTGLPAGTVTFLFTDIEGSTRLLHALGDRYADVLTDHRRLLREVFGEWGGREVDTQGDSFFVAFAHAGDAVRAAADGQRALAGHRWPEAGDLRVRMGLHTGEPLVAGDHYVGIDVHRGARIAAAAYGGQVLISARTCDLVQNDGALVNATLRELGAFPLKDLPEPERLFQLVVDGLPASFPPPRAYEKAPAAAGLPDYSLPPADVPCPYKGLMRFEAEDSDLFFGREELVSALLARLGDSPFLAVVGPSGSGKSSLVRAGVVPALERRERSTRHAIVEPGEHPLAELAGVLDADLVVVDQFEEVFTLCRDEEERREFVDRVLDAAEAGMRVIVMLRADFYGHCASYARLAEALEDRQALIGPMTEEELRRAIERPAEQAGLVLEPGLPEGILRDIVGEPGALPLLSHCLLETWRRRSDRMLTLLGYLHSGGVRGAIAKTAETVYRDAFTPKQQVVARNIFLRLTELGDGTEDTRRRASFGELTPRPEQAAAVQEVLRVLVDARLVTAGEGTVEVAHEALIRHWPTLRAWLDEDREGRLVHRRLTEAAQDWETLGKDPGALYRGTRLAAASEWAEPHDDELNELERQFLRASRDAELRGLETERRRNRRLRALLAGTGIALVAAIVAGLLALNQRNTARDTALTADAQRLGAEALTEDRLDRALLLARTGVALEETARTRSNLLATLLRSPHAAIGLLGGTADAEIFTTEVSPDGRVLAIGDAAGTVTTFDTSSRRKLGEYRIAGAIGGGLVQFVAFSSDGGTLAVTGVTLGGEPLLLLDLLDAQTLERRRRVELPPFPEPVDFVVATPLFVPGGRDVLVLQGFPDGAARSVLLRVDGDTGAVEGTPLRVGRTAVNIVPSHDGRRVFVPSAGDDATHEIDVGTLRVVRRHQAGGFAGALSPDGDTVALGSDDGRVRLLDLHSGRMRPLGRRHATRVLGLEFTPDGRSVVSSDLDGSVRVWNVATGAVGEELSAHRGPVWQLAVSPDGRTLYSAGDDGRMMLWDIHGDRRLVRSFSPRGEFEALGTPRGIAVSPDGKTLALTERGGAVDLFDTGTLQRRKSVKAMRGFAAAVAFSPDGRLLAVGGEDGDVTLWDARTLAPAGALRGISDTVQAVAFSPDGEVLAAAPVDAARPRLHVWNVGRRTVAARVDTTAVASLAFSPDGRVIALSSLDGGTEIRDARSGRLLRRLSSEDLSRSVAFSPDGSLLAVGQFDGNGQLYTTDSWEPFGRRLEAHTQRITNVEFSRDGRSLATSSADGTAQLWDVATQEAIGSRLAVEPDTFVSAALTPDGHLFAVSTKPRGVRLAIDPEAWKRHACLVAGRELTQREWRDALAGRRYRAVCSVD